MILLMTLSDLVLEEGLTVMIFILLLGMTSLSLILAGQCHPPDLQQTPKAIGEVVLSKTP